MITLPSSGVHLGTACGVKIRCRILCCSNILESLEKKDILNNEDEAHIRGILNQRPPVFLKEVMVRFRSRLKSDQTAVPIPLTRIEY